MDAQHCLHGRPKDGLLERAGNYADAFDASLSDAIKYYSLEKSAAAFPATRIAREGPKFAAATEFQVRER